MEGLLANAHTLADSPADAYQYPVILWYDTVDNQTVLQSDSEHVSCCYCLRHVLVGALVRERTPCGGTININDLAGFELEAFSLWVTYGLQKTLP